MMKSLLLFFSLILVTSHASDFPSEPFTFIGIPEKIRDESYETVDGRVRLIQIRVIEVKKGSYREKEIGFDFPADSKPPLEIGQRYLFTAVYDRHGIRYTDWKKQKEPNQPPQTTRAFGPRV